MVNAYFTCIMSKYQYRIGSAFNTTLLSLIYESNRYLIPSELITSIIYDRLKKLRSEYLWRSCNATENLLWSLSRSGYSRGVFRRRFSPDKWSLRILERDATAGCHCSCFLDPGSGERPVYRNMPWGRNLKQPRYC